MKNLIIIVLLAIIGAGAAYGYLQWSANRKPQSTNPQPAAAQEKHDEHDGHDHSADKGEGDAHSDDDGHDHAAHAEADAAVGTALCAKHRIPERIDAFCHPELVEKLGHCGEHGVPEAFCSRCNASLIIAFKAENDWCAEHELPESQCAICNPSIKPSIKSGETPGV